MPTIELPYERRIVDRLLNLTYSEFDSDRAWYRMQLDDGQPVAIPGATVRMDRGNVRIEACTDTIADLLKEYLAK
ncbi:MAG: hypothetical protein J4469_01860 [Candidatus Aenigmarchaeota archaeon]|nr:hypothetical protein [Candidatus Aenigmarchaeota archaeon]